MSSRDGAGIRLLRLNRIASKIASTFPEGATVENTVLWIQVELGLTEEVAKKYIDLVVRSRGWKIEGDRILPGETVE